jgi:type IV secretion system protein VirD4
MFDWQVGVEILAGILVVATVAALVVSRSEPKDAVAAWDAGFAKSDKTGLAGKQGIYLGRDPKSNTVLHYNDDRHIMTLGPNGSGKSMRLLYENLLRLDGWSIVVVDPKGDLARLTAERRRQAGNRVIILDPFGASGFESDRCNPLRGLNPDADDFPDDALSLAEAIIRLEGREPHWAASAQDLVAACIMAESLSGPDGNLSNVRALLGKKVEDFREAIQAMVAMGNENECPELAIKAERYADITTESRELMSVISTALTQTRWLDSRQIGPDLTSSEDYDFASLKTTPTTVYLVLPPRQLATHSPWLRLIVTAILQPLLKDTTPPKVPVLLMLDEYPALAEGDGFPIIARNMAMFRGYGIKLWSVWQDLSQAERIYGQHWESFAANAGVLQSFQPQDIKTAAYLSERSGITARDHSNWSWSGKAPSFSGNQQGMPLLLPQAVRALGSGETLIFSHVANGPVRAFLPFPDLAKANDAAARDSQAETRQRAKATMQG